MITALTEQETDLMKKRGFATEEEMLEYLNYPVEELPRFSSLLNGEALLRGILEAIAQNDPITIYGDYDADGIMAMTILYQGLTRLGAGRVGWFANDRFRNGYSITPESLEDCLAAFPDTRVILTCDNGIGAVEAWEKALQLGIRVFVTDHHEQAPDRILPEGILAVCEKSVMQKERFLEEGREAEDFCGAELARRLVLELFERKGIAPLQETFLHGLLAYSGLATVTDVVPLHAGNRAVLREAVQIIRRDRGIWRRFHRFLMSPNLPQEKLDEDAFGYYFGPAINAPGRLSGSVKLPMQALLAGEDESADELLMQMAKLNNDRKTFTGEDLEFCKKEILKNGYEKDPVILIAAAHLREGINGLTAGKLCELYKVPVIVLGQSENPKIYKGSARSTDEVDIFRLLYSCRDLLTAFGGHPKAAGLSIEKEKIAQLRRLLIERSVKSGPDKGPSEKKADFYMTPEKLSARWIQNYRSAVERLHPFGEGFEQPKIYFEGQVSKIYLMKNDLHAKAMFAELSEDQKEVAMLLWNKGALCKEYLKAHSWQPPYIRGYVKNPDINEFNGRVSCQVVEEDVEFGSRRAE